MLLPRTLLVAVASDPASVSLRNEVLRLPIWEAVAPPLTVECEVHRSPSAWLVHFTEPSLRMTQLDDVDETCKRCFGERPSDVVFLSRHTAASGTPALCVHPIGVPADASATHGGWPGIFVPPSPLVAPLYRELRRRTKAQKLCCEVTGAAFKASLEATHHGPRLRTPSCFVEVGSSEVQYAQPAAAKLWAEILRDVVLDRRPGRLWADLDDNEQRQTRAILALGGGHYQPKTCDFCAVDGTVFLGHMLATYNFGSLDGDDDSAWQATVRAAVDATIAAYPNGGGVHVRLEKKAFKAAARSKLVAFVADLGLECELY